MNATARSFRTTGSLWRFRAGVAGAVITTAAIYLRQHQRLRLDAVKEDDPILRAPLLKWVPPTREEMLDVLKKSTKLSKKYEPSEELATARNMKIPQIGDEKDGYDLLVSRSDRVVMRGKLISDCFRSLAVALLVLE